MHAIICRILWLWFLTENPEKKVPYVFSIPAMHYDYGQNNVGQSLPQNLLLISFNS